MQVFGTAFISDNRELQTFPVLIEFKNDVVLQRIRSLLE